MGGSGDLDVTVTDASGLSCRIHHLDNGDNNFNKCDIDTFREEELEECNKFRFKSFQQTFHLPEGFRLCLSNRAPSEILTLSSMFCGHVNLGAAVTMFLWSAERGAAAAVFVAFVACAVPYAALEWSDHRKRRMHMHRAPKPSRGTALPDNAVLAIST